MNNQEGHQKNSGKAHGNFFPDRRCVEVFPGHIEGVIFFEAQKYIRNSQKAFLLKNFMQTIPQFKYPEKSI